MAVLDRSELEASPLADLHAIADQLGLEGFRRLRKADLIDTILGEPAAGERLGGIDRSAPPRTTGRRTPRTSAEETPASRQTAPAPERARASLPAWSGQGRRAADQERARRSRPAQESRGRG